MSTNRTGTAPERLNLARRHPARRILANALVALACWIDPPFIRAGYRRRGGL